MKILDHTKDSQGYHIRVWVDETNPEAIEQYDWIPYKSDSSVWNFTESQYIQQQIDQATKKGSQALELLYPTQTVLSENKTAIASLEALKTVTEEEA